MNLNIKYYNLKVNNLTTIYNMYYYYETIIITSFLSAFVAEHKQFQKVISTLERDVADLKKEISERDGTIQDKEKRIYELKRKKQELEKYKFVLNFKIAELKNQVNYK